MTDPFLPEHDDETMESTPWGFRIVVLSTALYLAYRLWQGVVWLLQRAG